MADDQDAAPEEGGGKKGGKKPLIIGAAAMVLCGAGAFAAVSVMGGDEAPEMHAEEGGPEDDGHGEEKHAEAEGHGEKDAHGEGLPAVSSVAFVPVAPLTVTVGQGAERQHLRFTSQLEVPYARKEEVASLMPRVVDALGGYLRALEPAMLADRDAHLRMRGQMLRRVRLVVGPDAVHDLLVTEFVLN